jgi:hypothetical protein
VAVGDTCLVRVRKGRRVQVFPVHTAADFGNQPALIGSRQVRPAKLVQCCGSLRRGDRLFLMTDALAQWFLSAAERGGRPWETVAPLLATPGPESAFAAWVEDLRDRGVLRNDDVTLVTIHLSAFPKE